MMALSKNELELHVDCIFEARKASTYSKDPTTKVGAAIFMRMESYYPPIGVGCNGFPKGLLTIDERLHDRPTKYMYTVHAETAALFDLIQAAQYKKIPATRDLVMYVYGVCVCTDCMKDIAQAGIKEVYYYRNSSEDSNSRWPLSEGTQAIVNECGIKFATLNFKQVTDEIARRDRASTGAESF